MLILASGSRARKKLLQQIGLEHKVMISNVPEEKSSLTSSKELVQELAIKKAECIVRKINSKSFSDSLKNNYLAVLGCDSLFDFNGEIYGKPKNTKEAFDRWKKMSGSSGVINTGHCLISKKILSGNLRSDEFNYYQNIVVSTRINFAKLSDLEIERYVNSKEPFECAGGFSIEGKAGRFINSIHGCFSNVIGLSLPWLSSSLLKAEINYL